MKRTLLATTALVAAGGLMAASASAADKLQAGVSGYMEQYVGYVGRSDDSDKSVVDISSDAEVYFGGKLETDDGLTFAVHVQLEANAGRPPGGDNDKHHGVDHKHHTNVIDESFARMSGDFGTLEIGARDSINSRTHYGLVDVGVGLESGDTQKWIPGTYLSTSGWHADNKNIIYITPRFNGFQAAASYGPNGTNEYKGTPSANNDEAVWAAGANLNQDFDGTSVKVSAGYRSQGNPNGEDKTFLNAGIRLGFGAVTLSGAYAKGSDTDARNGTTFSVGGMYSQGAAAFSVGFMQNKNAADKKRTGSMVSARYTIAPGVEARGSVFMVEDKKNGNEGTAAVGGLRISF